MLYLIRGWPGSGKTTTAKEMLSYGTIDVYYEADMYFDGPVLGYVFDPTKLGQAHAWCLRKTKEALEAGKNVAVSNTFTRLWELQKYIDLGFPYEIIECQGTFKNVHGVPLEKVLAMRARFEEIK
jgi:adenylate kinase family enzyme